MGKVIYDIFADTTTLTSVRGGYFDRNGVHPRSEYGEFGTAEWWQRLLDAGILITKMGRIVELLNTGHGGNFPEFVLQADDGTMQFERRGVERAYRVGMELQVTFAREGDLFNFDATSPYRILENRYTLLRVETAF